MFDAVFRLTRHFILPPQKFLLRKAYFPVGMTMVSQPAIVVKPIKISVVTCIVVKAMLLVALSAQNFGKAAAFQPLRRISRSRRTITTPKFSLSTQLPMSSSSIDQERKVPVNSSRSLGSSSSQQQQSDDGVFVLDPLIVCGPSGVGTC
jgi:hypothetical protein